MVPKERASNGGQWIDRKSRIKPHENDNTDAQMTLRRVDADSHRHEDVKEAKRQ